MCKTKDIGNNVPINIINNHITMHVISPKLTHMYISYIQRPFSFRNLIYSLLWNEYVLVEMLVYWIPQQRRELRGDRNAPTRRTFCNSVFCANLVLVYPHCSESFECTNGTWTWREHSGANSAQRGRILMLVATLSIFQFATARTETESNQKVRTGIFYSLLKERREKMSLRSEVSS